MESEGSIGGGGKLATRWSELADRAWRRDASHRYMRVLWAPAGHCPPDRPPESFNLVCHSCEGVLRIDVTPDDLEAAQHSTGKKTQPVAWA